MHTRTLATAAATLVSSSALAQSYTIDWYSVDGGGVTSNITTNGYYLLGTIGQPDAGLLAGPTYQCLGGFWAIAGAGSSCYVNCDGSTTPPVLNIADFVCFQQAFAASDPYANCDGSTSPPILNIADFVCFQQRFAAGCS